MSGLLSIILNAQHLTVVRVGLPTLVLRKDVIGFHIFDLKVTLADGADKLSPNQIVSGFKKQLQIYNTAEQAFASWYIVIDVGSLGKKFLEVEAERNNQIIVHGQAPELILIDGSPKPSASKA